MVLPEELARSFKQVVRSYEEAQRMRYITSIERLASEEGREEGIELGALQQAREDAIEILQTRFGEVPNSIVEIINGIEDASLLKTIFKRAIAIESMAEFQQFLAQILPDGTSDRSDSTPS